MQGVRDRSHAYTCQTEHTDNLLCLAPLILFALPREASQGMTPDEIIPLFKRLEGCIGEQIQRQCHLCPSTLQNILQQLQEEGLVASTQMTGRVRAERSFWRLS